MAQTLLETLTVKQLLIFTIILFMAMASFFVIGGTKGADPATANIHIANLFVKKDPQDFSTGWVWYIPDHTPRDGASGYHDGKLIDLFMHHNKTNGLNVSDANQLILSTKFPHPGSVTMHKEFQFMMVVMTVQMEYRMENKVQNIPRVHECQIEFNAKLGYNDEDDNAQTKYGKDAVKWKLLSSVNKQIRPLTCEFSELVSHDGHKDGYYNCDDQYLFELGSVSHKHYIINMQFPGGKNNEACLASNSIFFSGVHFTEIHQNGGYTYSLFVSKTVMFPFILAALLFFLKRIKRENREKTLLEQAAMFLGIALSFLLLPVDWFTLVLDMPFMLLFSDLRQGLFYAALLIFWCIFAGEHILDQQERNKIGSYKIEISSILVGCLSLFIFDCVERGIQLGNPFHTIWKKDAGETAARAFLGVASAASIIYCLFFLRLLYFVYRNIRMKEVALPAMQEDRKRYYENRIYRFRVLLWVTLFTVFATVICFVLDQINETSWKFEDSSINDFVLVSSAMHFGMFGMWGTYVFAVLILYSPTTSGNSGPNVQYRRSEHLLHAGDGSVDASVNDNEDEDDIMFRHPKT